MERYGRLDVIELEPVQYYTRVIPNQRTPLFLETHSRLWQRGGHGGGGGQAEGRREGEEYGGEMHFLASGLERRKNQVGRWRRRRSSNGFMVLFNFHIYN